MYTLRKEHTVAGEISLKLNQEESNLVLRALETLEETCVAAVEPEECKALQRLWGRVFDAGVEAGFGEEEQELTLTQQIDVFDMSAEEENLSDNHHYLTVSSCD